jgi:dienelactone hydrolase
LCHDAVNHMCEYMKSIRSLVLSTASALPWRKTTIRDVCSLIAMYLQACTAVLIFGLICIVPALSQELIPKYEVIGFESQNLTDHAFLTGKRDGKPVNIHGELRIPPTRSEKLPAVILLHGSGGWRGTNEEWSKEFHALGVATFLVDSFTGRGITSTAADQDQLSRLVGVLDAYRALEALVKHPRIDGNLVVVMGFSRGGGAAHWTAIKRFYALHGPAGGLMFAAHIALYPTCNRLFIDRDVVDRPIRIFHGAADDYIPAASCGAYVERLREAGKDIAIAVYPGAHHAFDNPKLAEPIRAARAQTTRNCPVLEESANGRIVNSKTKAPFSYASDPCVERGATIGYHAQAHADVTKAVKQFVRSTLQLQ